MSDFNIERLGNEPISGGSPASVVTYINGWAVQFLKDMVLVDGDPASREQIEVVKNYLLQK